MDEFQLGCQTITFGGDQNEDFAEVFDAVAAAGYDGVEIGFRHIKSTPPENLGDMLDKAGISLLGTHLGGNLEDKAQADSEKDMLDDVLDYLDPLGTSLIMYSGLRYEDSAQFQRELDMLGRSAQKCQDRGVSLCYHNHNWEFENDGRIIKSLLNDADEALGFCPDIGWVMKGGWDITKFLNAAGNRVKTLHFKDFATTEDEVDTVILGTGVAPLKEAAQWAHSNMTGGWITAEQDSASIPAEDAVWQNAQFLQTIFS